MAMERLSNTCGVSFESSMSSLHYSVDWTLNSQKTATGGRMVTVRWPWFPTQRASNINSVPMLRHHKRQMDRRTYGRTTWNQYTPPFNFVEAGGIISVCKVFDNLHVWLQQGKSEGFDSCDRPSILSILTYNWIQILNFWAHVTWKFDGRPQKTIGQLFYTMSSFVHHFKAIGKFKLELQSGNAQFGSKLVIFCPLWPQNLTDDLEN